MNESMPSVSVVIPALNAADVIGKALESIENQTYKNIVEVIVAAGDSETARVSGSHGARVVDNPTGSTPAGLNLGLAIAAGELVVRLDAHAVLPPGYIERAVDTLQTNHATNVGGMQIPIGETYWERSIAAAMSSPVGAGDARYRIGGTPGPAETVYLGVYRRAPVLELGGFDEAFLRNQDYELNHRIIDSGGVVWFDPDLKVEYKPRGSLRSLWSQYVQYGTAKRQFARTHPGSLRLRQVAAPALVVVLSASLFLSMWWPPALWIPVAYLLSVVLAVMSRGLGPTNAGSALAIVVMHLAWGLGFIFGMSSREKRTRA